MRIYCRRLGALVPQQFLNIPQIYPAFQKMCRKRVPQAVDAYLLPNPRCLAGVRKDLLHSPCRYVLAPLLTRKEPGSRPHT